jgi:hypothetical protein
LTTYALGRPGADTEVESAAASRHNCSVSATTQRRPALVERIILRTRGTLVERDPLLALDELQALRAELDAYEHELVGRALRSGATFAAVARSLRISRQAAHRRYRDEFTPRIRSIETCVTSSSPRTSPSTASSTPREAGSTSATTPT